MHPAYASRWWAISAGSMGNLQNLMASGQALTTCNSKLTLTIAANYGGRWDMMQAVQAWQVANPSLSVADMDEAALRPYLSMGYAPDPTCLFVLAASRASAISCCGKWLIPNCFLPTPCGLTSTPSHLTMRCSGTRHATVALVLPESRASK